MERAGEPPVDEARERFEREEGGGRHDDETDREGEDVPPSRVANGEELGARVENVEEGLDHRQAPEGDEMEAGPEGPSHPALASFT